MCTLKLPKHPLRLASMLWCITGLLSGTAMVLAAEAEGVILRIRPSICVSYDSEAPCMMAMQVSWEAPGVLDVCLYESGIETALQCWSASRSGTVELTYANNHDVAYQLTDQLSGAVLAEADITVINRDLRSSRKRRRHVWSIL